MRMSDLSSDLCSSDLMAVTIVNKYGARTQSMVSENPWLLAAEVSGIGFASADQIAINDGVRLDHPSRLKAGIIHVLRDAAEREGHCALQDRKSVVEEKSVSVRVDHGGERDNKKKKNI